MKENVSGCFFLNTVCTPLFATSAENREGRVVND